MALRLAHLARRSDQRLNDPNLARREVHIVPPEPTTATSPSSSAIARPGKGGVARGSKGWYGPNNGDSVFEVPSPRRQDEHPTSKLVELVEARITKVARPKSTPKVKQVRRVPNQRGVPEGQARWFCSVCMKGFLTEAETPPETCPEGHAREVDDEFAPADGLKVADDAADA